MIIGLLGKAGSGKSTVAQFLVDEYSFEKFSFAKPLKDMAMMIYDLSHDQVWGTQEEKETVDERWGKSPRELLQFLGTEVCRDHLGKDVWVNAAMAKIEASTKNWVCDDVRFVNESMAIKKANAGAVVFLDCPDAPPSVNEGHASEQIDDVPFDYMIVSRRDANDLLVQADELFGALCGGNIG